MAGRPTGGSELVEFAQAAALREKQFEQLQKGLAFLKPEQLLDVARPVGIKPFCEILFREIPGQQIFRQTAVKQACLEVPAIEVREFAKQHGR